MRRAESWVPPKAARHAIMFSAMTEGITAVRREGCLANLRASAVKKIEGLCAGGRDRPHVDAARLFLPDAVGAFQSPAMSVSARLARCYG